MPLSDDPIDLTAARSGEGDRPWSAGAGAACLATGLTETVWILEKIRKLISPITPVAHLSWPTFNSEGSGLFLWEAFVTKHAKQESHRGDAEVAVNYFHSLLPNPVAGNAIKSAKVRSLIGAAILQSKCNADLRLLETPCLVLRA